LTPELARFAYAAPMENTDASRPEPASPTAPTAGAPKHPRAHPVALADALRVWARIGFLGFGGPAGQIALMHRELVERRNWIDEARFLHALSYCTLLPGPEAQQLATYVGWLLHRTKGGLAAGLLFVLPGALAILALSALYAAYRELPLVSALFAGLKAAVLAVVVEALIRIGRRALIGPRERAIALSAFAAIFCFGVSFPLIVLAAGSAGWLASRFGAAASGGAARAADLQPVDSVIARMERDGLLGHTRATPARALRTAALWACVWIAPLAAIATAPGMPPVFADQAWLFSRAAVVTFGGAYAVLAYVAQQAVETYHWLAPGEMLDGLGLAETTPGPLILVLQFVGYVGAYRQPGELSPLAAGAIGSLVTLWATFAPCFLWIFAGAPWIESLRGSRRLAAVLAAITAAVVGVVLNLSLWFALHVLFGRVAELRLGPLRLLVPELASLDAAAAALATVAALALFRFRIGVPATLAGCAALGALVHFAR
jgi:chromate transporter